MKETTPKKSIATEVENTAAQNGGANQNGNLNHKCRKCLHVTYTLSNAIIKNNFTAKSAG